jgi:hypothetical protein
MANANDPLLVAHLNIGPDKPVSYLPIKTIEKVIGLTIAEYRSLIEKSGNEAAVFDADVSCIASGAVYAYGPAHLERLLRDNRSVLAEHNWPTAPAEFIKRAAGEWLEDTHPVMPIITKAFGSSRA